MNSHCCLLTVPTEVLEKELERRVAIEEDQIIAKLTNLYERVRALPKKDRLEVYDYGRRFAVKWRKT